MSDTHHHLLEDIVRECNTLWSQEFETRVINILSDNRTGVKRSRQEYHLRSKYALSNLAGVTKIVTKKDGRFMTTKESVISIISGIHLSTGHKGETKTHKKIIENYANIPRRIVSEFIKQCERCTEKLKRKETASGIVIKPITVSDLNQRGQVDLVDFQSLPDGNYRYIMHYQEHLTKFHLLRALVSKTAKEVSEKLLSIFLEFGAPHVLQSDNGREFTAQIIRELATLWPGLVLVNGRPRHPQSQGSVERSNATLKNSLVAWMRDNNSSNWTLGLKFVQWNMNTTYHETIKMEPYKAMFGVKPKMGLGTNLPIEFLNKIQPGIHEESFREMLKESQRDTAEILTPQQESNSQSELDSVSADTDNITGEYIVVSEEFDINVDGSDELDSALTEQGEETILEDSPVDERVDLSKSVVNSDNTNDNDFHPAIKLRKVATENMENAAKKMIERTNKKLTEVKVGDCVNVTVPAFDRGRGDPANLIGVVLNINEDKFKIGTKGGIIENWLPRNCFDRVKYEGLSVSEVPPTELSIRALVRKLSVGNGQGFKRCSCKLSCVSRKCQCYKNQFFCNSSCHPSKSCKNH